MVGFFRRNNFAFLPIHPRLVSRHAREFSITRHIFDVVAVTAAIYSYYTSRESRNQGQHRMYKPWAIVL